MDSDGELRLTIMATLAQEESRKKPLISQRNQRLDLRCVQLKMGKNFMPEHRATAMRKCRRMKFLCIISGCPTGARKWHISYFCHAFAWQK